MTYINWDQPFYFDPMSRLPVAPDPGTGQPSSTEGLVPVPTYGNYGGAFYSQGDFLESPFDLIAPDERPLDSLDKLFLRHDRASFLAGDDPALIAAADLALIGGILNLSDPKLADPEASLYAGLATLAMIDRVVASGYPVSPFLLLAASVDAYKNLTYGLAGVLSNPSESIELLAWLDEVGDAFPTLDLDALALNGSEPMLILPPDGDGFQDTPAAATSGAEQNFVLAQQNHARDWLI